MKSIESGSPGGRDKLTYRAMLADGAQKRDIVKLIGEIASQTNTRLRAQRDH